MEVFVSFDVVVGVLEFVTSFMKFICKQLECYLKDQTLSFQNNLCFYV